MSNHEQGEHLTSVFATDTPALLNYLQRRVGIQDSPDLLAEVMVTAWRRIAVLPKDPEQARMWLFGIARNVLADHSRGGRHDSARGRYQRARAQLRVALFPKEARQTIP